LQVKGFRQPVVFRRLDGRNAEVEAGPLRMKIALADIIGIESDSQPAKKSSAAAALRVELPSHSAER